MARVEIQNLTRRPVPRFAYTTVAETVLPDWEVSLVFVGAKKATELNTQLRGKTYTPNVLSYALGKQSGEIFICLQEAERQAPAYDMNSKEFVLFLFIHGLLHLKGWAHSGTMERCEQTLMAQFAKRTAHSSYGTANSNRDRHRHLPSKSGSRRGTR
ncbi:MAG TPA: rRNA maturation RNase YbeY [Candidatus Paceibacterota bacterium]|nr:rRNA maturation RNase YbeY [Candidatus Paceibacterota bacterium]